MRFSITAAVCTLLSLSGATAVPYLTFYQDPGCPKGTGKRDIGHGGLKFCQTIEGLRPEGQSIRVYPQDGAKGCLQIYTGPGCTGKVYGYNIDRGNRPGCFPMDLVPASDYPPNAAYYAYFPGLCPVTAGELSNY